MGPGAGAESQWEKGWTDDSTVIWTLSGQSTKSVSFTYSLDQDLWNWEMHLPGPPLLLGNGFLCHSLQVQRGPVLNIGDKRAVDKVKVNTWSAY